jgi:phenylacetate-CoA ligase
MRDTYAWAYARVLYPAWQRVVRRRHIASHLAVLEASQWLSHEEIAARQLDALRALLDHAARNVPYWRELFRRVGLDPRGVTSARDLEALPPLTREIIHERYDEMVDPALRPTNIHKGTSGTTGVPLRFEYCNGSEAWRQATRLRGYSWAGYDLGRPTLHYWGTGATLPRGLAAAKIRLDRALRREVYVDAVKQDEAHMRATADRIARLRPHLIVAYTQALAAFARWVVERGARRWDDVRVVCAAEALLESDRRALEDAFGPHIFETYGSRETMLIAAECEAHDGMHLSEENLLVEIARRDGRAAGPGEPGDVLVTDLHNYGMPLIRYANGDVARLASPDARRCACGRGLRRLAAVDGRRADMLRNADGDPVPGMLFVSLLQTAEQALRAFQVVQRADTGEVTLRIVRGPQFDDARFAETVRRARDYFGGLPFRVVECDSIPTSPSGKRRPIVVERPAAA